MPGASFAIVNGSRWITEEEKQQNKATNAAARFISCLVPYLDISSLTEFTPGVWGSFVLARFVSVKSSKGNKFVEVFYVAEDPVRRRHIQELERQLNDPKRLMRMKEARILYVHQPGPIPSSHHADDIPLGVRHVLQRLSSKSESQVGPRAFKNPAKEDTKNNLEAIEIVSDESDDDLESESFSFALIAAAEDVHEDQVAHHRPGHRSTLRFWSHIQNFTPADQQKSKIVVISKLAKISWKSYREVFCIKPSSAADEKAQADVYDLKNRLRKATSDLLAMGMIFVERPAKKVGHSPLYQVSEQELKMIRQLALPNILKTSTTSKALTQLQRSSPKRNPIQTIRSRIPPLRATRFNDSTEVEVIDISDDEEDAIPAPGSKHAPIDIDDSDEDASAPFWSAEAVRSNLILSLSEPPFAPVDAAADDLAGSLLETTVLPIDLALKSDTLPGSALNLDEISDEVVSAQEGTRPIVAAETSIVKKILPLTDQGSDVDMLDSMSASSPYSQRASSTTPPRSRGSEDNDPTEHEADENQNLPDTAHSVKTSSDDELLLKPMPNLPTSEQSSDTGEGLVEDTDSYSEWAGRMAASMHPKVAKRYLAKARKYHRDPLDSSFSDMMRNLPTGYQRATFNRAIFESWILQNTPEESEAPPITVKNNVDDEPCPAWDFTYTNALIRGDGVPKPLAPEVQTGCQCVGGCRSDSSLCACAKRQEHYALEYGNSGFLYDSEGRLVHTELPIFECNDACTCAIYCRNRVVQRGRRHALEIRKTSNRGWGVFAKEPIPAGSFIGVYSGELLLDAEAEVRGKELYNLYNRNYLFDLDFWVIKKVMEDRGKHFRLQYTIDAMHAGCFTRYLNHSCDPNSVIVPCIFGGADAEIPYLCFFTRRDVGIDEEITFSYKGDIDEDEEMELVAARRRTEAKKLKKGKKKVTQNKGAQLRINVECKCGAANCNGSIWNWRSSSSEEDG